MINTIPFNAIALNNTGGGKAAGGVKYEDFIISGTDFVQIEKAKANSLAAVVVSGGLEQPATPTPSAPVAPVCNRGALSYGALTTNLLNVREDNVILGKYINNNGAETGSAANFYVKQYIPVKAGATYTVGASKAFGYVSFMEYDAGYNFLSRTLIGSGTSSAVRFTKHTMRDDAAFVIFGSNPTSAEITFADVKAFSFRLVEGALNYNPGWYPYVGGLKANGTDEVRACSPNLNEGTLDQVGYTSTGGESSSSTFCGTLHRIPVHAGQKYTVSFGNFPDGASGVFINTWKADGSWNARQAISSTGKLTYTIPDGVGWVNFTLYKTGGITIGPDSWMQVEHGSEATDYQPAAVYGTANAGLLYEVAGRADTQDIISGQVIRRVGVKIFDGTERFSLSSGTFNYGAEDKLKSATPVLCSHYPYTAVAASSAPDKTIKSYSSVNIGFKDSSFATVAEFTAYLAEQYAKGTPVIVFYPLAEEKEDTWLPPNILPNPAGSVTVSRRDELGGLGLEVKCKAQKQTE